MDNIWPPPAIFLADHRHSEDTVELADQGHGSLQPPNLLEDDLRQFQQDAGLQLRDLQENIPCNIFKQLLTIIEQHLAKGVQNNMPLLK